ncbi:MAG TPA: tRNA (adenosine(37)-N6)-threonylcarbamoyltransferase complex dimerization subunit type 1 TsaB [Marinospirillum sp.]|uniref:tRNA (adenosine(37)-N6)-threonylcarbamoyltransferase complex dimerization subunit type 1 TsaB n=1 Tax=Marinospirillum sp. TaxID=2183934 RepID=UPI002B45C36D|nr:tRNA (adenosine(37)-N6)-threonylcarbamoyltransferase complex dimerization subunit type 1 TsaB [Marinospirillum sp.]HKM14906.1 tRNA (adenosine(37)-N6)-threonylcarbamoyltransferase complex dimerization subunit type 1 TsaB [Marinospirillum sp.]
MTCILALDTSTEAGSVAIWQDGEVLEDFQLLPRQQAQALLPQIKGLLNKAGIELSQVDALAFGRGPGSFTGLRIAAASIQGLALALDRPVIPVSTLEAMAWSAINCTHTNQPPVSKVLTLLDARMDEVYWCAWQAEQGWPVALMAEQLNAPEAVSLPAIYAMADSTMADWALIGSGACYADRLAAAVTTRLSQQRPDILPSAKAIVHLAHKAWQQNALLDAADAVPIYLRDNVTHGS